MARKKKIIPAAPRPTLLRSIRRALLGTVSFPLSRLAEIHKDPIESLNLGALVDGRASK